MAIKTGHLFLAIVLVELVHTLVAVTGHRVPISHDGFQYFTLQFYFLNNAIQADEVAQWIPYMTQGTIASLWHGIQASLFQSVLMHAPLLPNGADLLTTYHVGMFIDEMVLLTGTWLLARRFFSTGTVCFVTVSVVGSSVWLDQPYWNFKLYYALPLVLELGHRFLESARWRWAFLALNILAVQMMGTLPYLIPVVSFVVACYFAAFAAANPKLFVHQCRALRWGRQAGAALAGGAAFLGLALACFTIGTGELVNYNPYRNPDGTNSLSVFLTYGGATDLGKWADMALNLSPWMDFTLYCGILVLPLLLLSVLVVDRRRLHFLGVALVLLLFTLGTFVSTGLFYAWPGMKYFRHIGLVSPLVRVMWCFVAAIGFEWLFETPCDRDAWPRRVAGAGLAVSLVAIGLIAFRLSLDHQATRALLDAITTPGIDRPSHTQFGDALAHRLWISALLAWTGALVVGVGAIFFGSGGFVKARGSRLAWLSVVLVFAAADVYHFKFGYLLARSNAIPTRERFVERSSDMPYAARREIDLKTAAVQGNNPRLAATIAFSPMFQMRLVGRSSLGAQYWTNNLFVFADEAGSTFQVDSWLRPFDQLLRTYWRVPINDTSGFPPGVDLRQLSFPSSHPAAGRIAGVSEDKIRFFARAHAVGSVEDVSSLLSDATFTGNLLFVLRPEDGTNTIGEVTSWTSRPPLSIDESLPLRYHVEGFDANNLRVRVSGRDSPSWMYYADVWHPFWKATVNGRQVSVLRANIAYKAVPLNAGENVVQLTFGSQWFSALSLTLAMNAAFWLVMVAAMMWHIVTRPEVPLRASPLVSS